MAFQNLLYKNEENIDKVNMVVKTTMGFQFNEDNGKIEVPPHTSNISSDNENEQPTLLSLSKILSFLDQVGYLNTNVMRQLRLVLEFNTLTPSLLNYFPRVPTAVSRASPAVVTFASDAAALGFAVGQSVRGSGFVGAGWVGFNAVLPITDVTGATITITIDSTGFTGATPTTMGSVSISNYNNAITLEINRPYLLLDELHNANPAQYPMRPITYGSIESQSITVSANATSVTQRLNAWNNKKLLRLLMVNQDNGSYTNTTGGAYYTPEIVSKASPAIVTFGADAASLGFVVGQTVIGYGFVGTGWVDLNDTFPITAVTNATITITVDSTGYTGATPTTMGSFRVSVAHNMDLGVKKYKSLGMYNESWKFWANGEQLVPNQGISTDALKQYYLVDAWGKSTNINLPQGASDVRNQFNMSSIYEQSVADNFRNPNFCGNLSYGGLRVADSIDGQLINKLDLVYTREAFPDTPAGNVVRAQSQAGFTMVLYGEVEKQLVISNGEVMVIG